MAVVSPPSVGPGSIGEVDGAPVGAPSVEDDPPSVGLMDPSVGGGSVEGAPVVGTVVDRTGTGDVGGGAPRGGAGRGGQPRSARSWGWLRRRSASVTRSL